MHMCKSDARLLLVFLELFSKHGHASTTPVQARALIEYRAQTNDELELRVGDVIEVRSQDDYWWDGSINERTGKFPSTHVKILDPMFPDEWNFHNMPSWGAEDLVDVFYSRKPIQKWDIPGRERHYIIYHAGLGFRNHATGEQAFFEYLPRQAENSIDVLLPWFTSDIWVPAWKLEKQPFTWDRAAYVKYLDNFPANQTRWVRIARTNGAALRNYANWLKGAPEVTNTFDPFTIIFKGSGKYYASFSCMEFVDESIRAMYSHGVDITFDDTIMKDVNLIYAARASQIDNVTTCARCGREMARLGRLYQVRMLATSNWSFHEFRGKLALFFKAGLPVIFSNSQRSILRIELAPPFNNHCKMPVGHPAEDNDVFNPTLCALPMTISTFPSEHFTALEALIVAEERLDRPAVFMTLIIVIVTAAVIPRSIGNARNRCYS
mmetsp:Transcript_705/g.1196  ORF Transcript_705/g.1196 Transcript_705/m.1196 type:complete len:436 (-) Transcript_705:272-1579(-)